MNTRASQYLEAARAPPSKQRGSKATVAGGPKPLTDQLRFRPRFKYALARRMDDPAQLNRNDGGRRHNRGRQSATALFICFLPKEILRGDPVADSRSESNVQSTAGQVQRLRLQANDLKLPMSLMGNQVGAFKHFQMPGNSGSASLRYGRDDKSWG